MTKIQWFDFPQNLSKISDERLDTILNHNISCIEYLLHSPRGLSAHDEERYYSKLAPLNQELEKRKAALTVASTQENIMTNVTTRIKEGVNKAIQYLENGDSIRRACQKAGISVTSLYHNSTPEQRDQAYLKNTPINGNPRGAKRGRKPGRPVMRSTSVDVNQLQTQLKDAYDYIAKLEHRLVKSIILAENEQ